VPITNSFEEEFDGANTNVRIRKIAKPLSIFVAKIDNFSSQLLKEIAAGEYEIKIINKQIKIQPKSFIAYVNILKELKSKNTEFHTYKPKQEGSFRIVLKHIHATTSNKKLKNYTQILIYGRARSKTLKRLFIWSISS